MNSAEETTKRAAPLAPDQESSGPKKPRSVMEEACSTSHGKEKEVVVPMDIFAAVYGSKGIRPSMEDEHVVKFDLLNSYVEQKQSQVLFSQRASIQNPHPTHKVMFFAVYDGHGGRNCSQYLRDHLDFNVANALASLPSLTEPNAVKKAITDAFTTTDKELVKVAEGKAWDDGSTAIVMLVIDQTAYVANVGDSRAILAREADENGSKTLKSMALNKEHKAIFIEERTRIEKAGGFIKDGRVVGLIEVSRAFGDTKFKKYGVIALPEIQKFKISTRDRFAILACDGLWKVYDPKLVTKYVDERLNFHMHPPVSASGTAPEGHIYSHQLASFVARDLVKDSIDEKKSKDNVSVLLVLFAPPELTKSEQAST